MKFPHVTAAQWRAQVDKELAGAPFEKALVQRVIEGISIQPLYTEGPAGGLAVVDFEAAPFRICTRALGSEGEGALDDDLKGGADAVWLPRDLAAERAEGLLETIEPLRTFLVVDPGDADGARGGLSLDTFAKHAASAEVAFAWGLDPLGALARGNVAPSSIDEALRALPIAAKVVETRFPKATSAVVSTLPYHDAGADAADEIGYALATGATYLRILIDAGLTPSSAARLIALRVAVGRDTFVELCKLRALRVAWRKVVVAAGASDPPRAHVHAVCSSRTLTQRDPWVNMLRVTTQTFAAILGGADLVTPLSFDEALGTPSALGRRVARNTGLVLREESSLGRVIDPASGSYYFDTLTDALARQGWTRFQAIERDGGIVKGLTSGSVRAKLETSWRTQLEAVAKRKMPILGVSEFANLREKLPKTPPKRDPSSEARPDVALPAHRDAESFEALRSKADALPKSPEAILVPLGPLAESRPRVSFATSFFGAGGIRARETSQDEAATIACLCGSDERYAAEAVSRARALKAAGCKRVLLAGRPGALESALREAGVDAFLFIGCDTVALLTELLDAFQ